VCWVAGGLNRVVTTDTYNHKVKLLDPATNVISFWLGNGKPGLSDGERLLPHRTAHDTRTTRTTRTNLMRVLLYRCWCRSTVLRTLGSVRDRRRKNRLRVRHQQPRHSGTPPSPFSLAFQLRLNAGLMWRTGDRRRHGGSAHAGSDRFPCCCGHLRTSSLDHIHATGPGPYATRGHGALMVIETLTASVVLVSLCSRSSAWSTGAGPRSRARVHSSFRPRAS
jgi:hypothetical protein